MALRQHSKIMHRCQLYCGTLASTELELPRTRKIYRTCCSGIQIQVTTMGVVGGLLPTQKLYGRKPTDKEKVIELCINVSNFNLFSSLIFSYEE